MSFCAIPISSISGLLCDVCNLLCVSLMFERDLMAWGHICIPSTYHSGCQSIWKKLLGVDKEKEELKTCCLWDLSKITMTVYLLWFRVTIIYVICRFKCPFTEAVFSQNPGISIPIKIMLT